MLIMEILQYIPFVMLGVIIGIGLSALVDWLQKL